MEAMLSAKNQIVIPKEAREALGIKPGDKVLIVNGGHGVLVLQKPKSFANAFQGLGKGLCPPDYLEKERASWDR
jgi:AbrB family looped-hinge helix DNA binding protein